MKNKISSELFFKMHPSLNENLYENDRYSPLHNTKEKIPPPERACCFFKTEFLTSKNYP